MRVLICVVNRWIEEYWMIDSGLSDIDMRMEVFEFSDIGYG